MTGSSMAAKLSSEQTELERKLERNRAAFEAWLERKKEEQRKIAAEERKAAQLKLEIAEQNRGVGQAAFRNWLKQKQEEDELMKKDRAAQRELRKLKDEEKRERRQRAEETFNTWKLQKDLEISLQKSNEKHRAKSLSPPRESTPAAPGYCSVWSCDLEMASYITDHVPRGDKELGEVTPFSEQNFTICHDQTMS